MSNSASHIIVGGICGGLIILSLKGILMIIFSIKGIFIREGEKEPHQMTADE